MPLPELPDELICGRGTVADSRAAVRAFAIRMADLVNLALLAAHALNVWPRLEEDAGDMGSEQAPGAE
jgi:hypothetical protein